MNEHHCQHYEYFKINIYTQYIQQIKLSVEQITRQDLYLRIFFSTQTETKINT